MKKSLSLIELSVSIIILALFFYTFSLFYIQIFKNLNFFDSLNDLYQAEIELYNSPNKKNIMLKNSIFSDIYFIEYYTNDNMFRLKKIDFSGFDLDEYFFNEKSF